MDNEIIDSLKDILDYQLDFDMYALDFDFYAYERVIKDLKNSYSNEDIEKYKKDIHNAIKNYFYDLYQNVTIIDEPDFKIEKKFKNGYSEDEDRILHALRIDLALIFNQPEIYKVLPQMWLISEELRSQLFYELSKIVDDKSKLKDELRDEISYVFDLSSKDIILFYKKEIYIRLYIPPRERISGEERRYEGVNIVELKTLFNRLFPDGLEDKLKDIMQELLDEKLNFSLIDNSTFSNNFLQVFRSAVDMIIVESKVEVEGHMLEPLNGFILRNHFHFLLLLVAQNLLEYIERRDVNAERFLKHFIEKNVVSSKGGRLNRDIIDERGQKWGFSAILSAIVQNKQSLQHLGVQKYKIHDLQDKINEKREKLLDDDRELKEIKKKIQEIDLELKFLEKEISKFSTIKKSFFTSNDEKEKKDKLSERLELLKDKRKFLITSQFSLTKNSKNREIDLKNWVKKLKEENDSLALVEEQNREINTRYSQLVNAVAKSLARR